jgi:hypothetical protein
VVALDIFPLPDSGRIEVGGTLRPHARALDGQGDSVAATITWATLDTAILSVDSGTGATLGKAAGNGRIQAHAGNLRSNPLSITVLAALDSISASGSTVDTVTVSTPDSLSDSLSVAAWVGKVAAAGRRVRFVATIYPGGGTTVTFVPGDSVPTNSVGLAVVQLRYTGGPRPDSVVVLASARHGDGTAVAGSPVHFVVGFRP